MALKIEYALPIVDDATSEVTHTQMQLVDNGLSFTGRVQGDQISKSEETKIKLMLDCLYNQLFPNRAENEKFSEVDKAIKRLDEKAEEIDDTLRSVVISAEENRARFGKLEKSLDDKIKKAVAEAVKAELAKKAEGEA